MFGRQNLRVFNGKNLHVHIEQSTIHFIKNILFSAAANYTLLTYSDSLCVLLHHFFLSQSEALTFRFFVLICLVCFFLFLFTLYILCQLYSPNCELGIKID